MAPPAAAAAQADLEQVTSALLECEAYPPAARQMLFEGLPHALDAGSERHEFQAEFAGLAQTALLDMQQWAIGKQACCAESVQGARARLEEGQAACAEAEAKKSAAAAHLGVQVDRLRETQMAVQSAEVEHKAAAEVSENEQSNRSKLEEARAKAANIMEGPLRMLIDGGWADDEVKAAALEAVCGILKAVEAENALVMAVPAALETKPEDRGLFDQVTIESLQEAIHEKITKLDAQLARGADHAKGLWAEALGLWALLDVKRGEAAAQGTAKAEAGAALDDAVAAHKEAKKQVVEHESALSTALIEQTLIEAKSQAVAAALGAMERLIANEYEQRQQQEAGDVEMAGQGEDADPTKAQAALAAEPSAKGDMLDANPKPVSFDPSRVPTPMVK